MERAERVRKVEPAAKRRNCLRERGERRDCSRDSGGAAAAAAAAPIGGGSGRGACSGGGELFCGGERGGSVILGLEGKRKAIEDMVRCPRARGSNLHARAKLIVNRHLSHTSHNLHVCQDARELDSIRKVYRVCTDNSSQ